MFLFIFEREKQSASEGGAEREGDTESEAGFRLWAVSTEPVEGLELVNREIMTWAEVGCLTNWATQVPLYFFFFNNLIWIRGRPENVRIFNNSFSIFSVL